MAKVLFKRIEDSANINNIEIEDGSFIVTGDGKTYVDYGEDRIPTSGTPDTEMSDRSTNTVENNVIKEYVDNKVLDIYSTNEVKTNKIWIDGKPIYRKVFSIGSVSTSLDTIIDTGITTLNILVDVSGSFKRDGYDYLRYDISSKYWGEVSFNANNGKLSLRSDTINYDSGYIVLEYTKTND